MLGEFTPDRWRRSTIGANTAEIDYLDNWASILEAASSDRPLVPGAAFSDWELHKQLCDWRQNGPLGPNGGPQEGFPPIADSVSPDPIISGAVATVTGDGMIGVNSIILTVAAVSATLTIPFQAHTTTAVTFAVPFGFNEGDVATIVCVDSLDQQSNAISTTIATPPVLDSLNPDPIQSGAGLQVIGQDLGNVVNVTLAVDEVGPLSLQAPFPLQTATTIDLALPGGYQSGWHAHVTATDVVGRASNTLDTTFA